MKTTLSSELLPLSLPVRDRESLQALCHDEFQSPRARKRAHALLLLTTGTPVESVLFRTGLREKSLEGMLARLKTHGVHGAVFDRPHQSRQSQMDMSEIAEEARRLLASRPPPGHLRWGLEDLAAALHARLPHRPVLSRELVRQVLKNKLGIRSIRFVEPYWYQQVRKLA